MSFKVREWLTRHGIDTTHGQRMNIDREIERRTGQNCDIGISKLTDTDIMEIVQAIRKKRKPLLAEAMA